MMTKWADRWRTYVKHCREARTDTMGTVTVAQEADWNQRQYQLHQGLLKHESTVAILLRTEHIGLNDYLYHRKVPGNNSLLCECGWPRQTPKHVLIFCPRFSRDCNKMFQEAGTNDYRTLLSSPTGIRAVTRWFLAQDILTQFSLAKAMPAARRANVVGGQGRTLTTGERHQGCNGNS